MKVKTGHNRKVIIMGPIAIKMPRIYLREALKRMKKHFCKRELLFYLRIPFGSHIGGFQCLVFKGIIDNLEEFFFSYRYCQTRLPLPTLLSVFGLLNIQKRAGRSLPHDICVDEQLYALTNEDPLIAAHAFGDRGNFCVINGHLRIMDYASPEPRQVIVKYGEIIFNRFDVSRRASI